MTNTLYGRKCPRWGGVNVTDKPIVKIKVANSIRSGIVGHVIDHPILGTPDKPVRTSQVLRFETLHTIYEIVDD